MDLEKLLQVLRITVPVFALIGLGQWLRWRRWLSDDRLAFLNDLIYWFSLPALIFLGVARQPFLELLNPAIIVGSLGAVAIMTIGFLGASFVTGISRSLRSPFTFGTFFANVSYMGFPLAAGAFGADRGLAYAGVVNAFTMPVFIILAYVLMHYWGQEKHEREGGQLLKTLANPIIFAAVAGIAVSALTGALNLKTALAPHAVATGLLAMMEAFLELIGSMGLPLALIAVGGSLRLETLHAHGWPLLATTGGKLILAPLATLLIIEWIFPEAQPAARGVAVLLMATPAAVTSYVISKRLDVEPEFVASHLVLSTALSILSIPVWLYFLI